MWWWESQRLKRDLYVATVEAGPVGGRSARRRWSWMQQWRRVVVGGDDDRWWLPPNRDSESATVEAVEAGLVGGGGGRNSGELATVEATKAGLVERSTAVHVVEGDGDGDDRS
ncbi:hypothetical protein Syun_022914 [Stephania yunnanensis]|uniref:Uncharacterized protein n=1 Tax=Stephania yunnanensis TaxID=152371 RepID=A0AAP0HZ10_9MAGN